VFQLGLLKHLMTLDEFIDMEDIYEEVKEPTRREGIRRGYT